MNIFVLPRKVLNKFKRLLPMWFRRQTRLTLEKVLAYLGPTPALPPGLILTLPRPGRYDLIYFPDPKHNGQSQPPYPIFAEFAAHGHRFFQVELGPSTQVNTPNVPLTELYPFHYSLQLPDRYCSDLTRPDLNGNTLATCQQYFNLLRQMHGLVGVVCLVESSYWSRLAQALKAEYGWQILEDSADKTALLTNNYSTLSTIIRSLYGRASIIVISYNNLDYTRQCLESILTKTMYPNYEVIVVDNNSQLEVKEYLQQMNREYPDKIKVIFNNHNAGFASANNIGLAHCPESEFVVLLNNDVVVPRGWLTKLLKHLQDPTIGMVGPVTNWTGNEAKIDVPYLHPKDMEPFAEAYTQAHEGQIFDIKSLAMYCVAMRRQVFVEVGLLDEQFGVGMFEDDDYAMRVRQAGKRVICTDDAFVHHYGMASFSKLKDDEYKQLFECNKQLYEAKWGRWVPYKSR